MLFDELDSDADGSIDRADFKHLLSCIGLSLNDKEFYSTWIAVDSDRSGEVTFDEFFGWYKRSTLDPVTINIQRAIRMTRLLQAAKGAMIFAVDKGNAQGKRALLALFDCIDEVGTGFVVHDQLMQLVQDLQVDANEYDVLMALREMDPTGKGMVDLPKWTNWWCGTPNDSKSGVLRSKLKLAAFTSKANGPILAVVATSDEGAGAAEEYLNELLSAAFSQKSDLMGVSLGIFPSDSPFRLWCQHLIQNPLTDRLLVLIIFGNVGLMAAQTPGEESTEALGIFNFIIMVIFTAEMWMRIIVGGLVVGETAFLNSGWDVFDFVIINSVWALYIASLMIDVSDKIGFALAMLRSFRALRFFAHIRNILNSIIGNRVMIGAVMLLLLFLFSLLYVVGFQLFEGVADATCGAPDGCAECGEALDKCPPSFDCTAQYPAASACFVWEKPNRTVLSDGHFGFDSFSTSALTIGAIVTLDNWDGICDRFRRDIVVTSSFAWPTFAASVVGIGLFTVNLFVAGLAYSYIKVRKASRNLDAPGGVKKTLVERLLNDGRGAGANTHNGGSRHLLQILNPPLTRRCRRIMNSATFEVVTTLVVLVNIVFMACDHHQPTPQNELILSVGEAVFTVCYTLELAIKLQALGIKQYFRFMLNRLDFVIVSASLASYWIKHVHKEEAKGQGSAVLRMLRILKLMRAARVAKFIFRSPPVREMAAKAFSGMDAIISLIVFIFFLLTLASISGMYLFHGCSDSDEKPFHTPNFDTFGQSFLVSFQVMTSEGWTDLMFKYMDCSGDIAAAYFAFITCCCTFVLANLFVAIFMENFEMEDEQKRDLQVGQYIQQLAQDNPGSKEWVGSLQGGIRGVEAMLSETGSINILKNRTVDEFMRGARLTQKATQRTMRIKPVQKRITKVKDFTASLPGAKKCTACYRKTDTISARQRAWRLSIAKGGATDRPSCTGGGWKKREFWKYLANTTVFQALVLLAVVLSAVDTVLTADRDNLTDDQHVLYMLVHGFVFCALLLECCVKVVAYHFLGGIDEEVWPCPSTVFELVLVAIQIAASVGVPYANVLLPVRTIRLLYMVKRLRLMVNSFLASLTAVWTVFVLMAGSFLAFGIVGMNLFSGLLWRCIGAEQSNRVECEAAGLSWENRPFHWDNLIEASNSLFSVWTLQGWSEMWYWTIDTTYVDQAPSKDFSATASFLFFATFIMWNSLMLTNLFTGMLCDFFAQTSGSILMTSEQRNWQFMSMFLVESLRLEVTPPPDKEKLGGLAYLCFNFVQSRSFKALVDLTIFASIVSMIGQQAALSVDPTGVLADVLLALDEYVLVVFTVEAFSTVCGFGVKVYARDFRTNAVVLVTLWITTVQQILDLGWGELQALAFVRALRLVSVVGRVHAVKKIHFMVMVAMPQVVNLCSIMLVIFLISGSYAHMLCSDVPRGRSITADANFETVPAAMMTLFQLCTGQSMMGANHECAQEKGPHVLAFFAVFWFVTNLLLTNLFIALLLDNFDLMGSEDMAVSDMDIELFKRRWVRSAGPHGQRYSIHDSISLAHVRWFIRQPGMGTFSMMPEADPHYFNRVLFELHPEGGEPGDYTRQDVLDCERRRLNIRIHFFDLLLALCHIRFSSSCLTLANEVSKSALLIQTHEGHAARIMQVFGRAFVARRSVNYHGDRAMPGTIWFNGRPQPRLTAGVDFPEGRDGRCDICTLPRPWCGCRARQAALKKAKQMEKSGGTDFNLRSAAHDDNDEEEAMEDEENSASKVAWDAAVGVAAFLTLGSLINVDRITPEHVVANAFDRLQTVVDKRKTTNRLGMIRFTDDDTMCDSQDRDVEYGGPHAQLKDEVAVDVMVHELRKLRTKTTEELVAEFRLIDTDGTNEVSIEGFGTALKNLGLSFSPDQYRTLVAAVRNEGAEGIDYVAFADQSAEAIGVKLAEVTSLATALQTETKPEKQSKLQKWRSEKQQRKQQRKEDEGAFQLQNTTKFVNPLEDLGTFESSIDEGDLSGNAFESEAPDGSPTTLAGAGSSFDNDSRGSGSGSGRGSPVLPGAEPSFDDERRDSPTTTSSSQANFDDEPHSASVPGSGNAFEGEASSIPKQRFTNPMAISMQSFDSEDMELEGADSLGGEIKAVVMATSMESEPSQGGKKDKKKKKKKKLKSFKKNEGKKKDGDEDREFGLMSQDFLTLSQDSEFAAGVDPTAPQIPKVKMKKRDDVYRYKVVDVAELRTEMSLDSEALPTGHFRVGDSLVVTQRELLDGGVVGVQANGKQFGREHVYLNVTNPDGAVQLEYQSNDAQSYKFEVCAATFVYLTKSLVYSEADAARSKAYAKMQRCGKLKPGDKVEVQLYQPHEGKVRLKLHDGKGWTTLMDSDGVNSDENLRAVDPLDTLRLHLDGLSMHELRSEAVVTYQIDQSVVDEASSEMHNLDPAGNLIGLIVQNHTSSLRGRNHVATLLRCGEGLVEWFNPKDRVKVRRASSARDRGLIGKLGRIIKLTGSEDERGRETAEVLLDGERATRMIAVDDMTKLVDEAIATTLFDAVHADDSMTLAALLAQEIAPVDAIRPNKSAIPPGHERVADARNHEGMSLYQVARASRKPYCSEYLATRLMFQAVVDDDVAQLQQLLSEAGKIDCLCPHGAFPAVGDDGPYLPRPGRSSRKASGEAAAAEDEREYPVQPQAGEPLIERARMVWECAGSPQSEASASQMGGQCWVLLSGMWEDRFGKPYRKEQYEAAAAQQSGGGGGGGSGFTDMHSLLTAASMKQKFDQNHQRLASEQQVEETLQWKERKAFMTRKTQIS
eukprot:COSAG06_NODE_283_length_18377_cov_8.509301_6_plen_2777_part_00